jgi:predicted O-methyltransferase YrrM
MSGRTGPLRSQPMRTLLAAADRRARAVLPAPVKRRLRRAVDRYDAGRTRVRDARTQLRMAVKARPLVEALTEMTLEERVFLYSITRAVRPERVLEIGTSQGGSALIMTNALEENGSGQVYTVDPLPRIDLKPERFRGRLHVIQDFSPAGVDQAAALAGGPFDFVLIDGLHIHDQTAKDIAASLTHAADEAYILLHDAFHFGISEAIREAVERETRLYDCGYVCRTPRAVGTTATHAGFRLLRLGPPTVDPTPLVRPLWEELGTEPPHDRALLNHDLYYCQYVEPCPKCTELGKVVV